MEISFLLLPSSFDFVSMIMDKAPLEKLNICVTYMKEDETMIRVLTEDEIYNLYDSGRDFFLNLSDYEL